jgi:hypothetical protein
VIWSACAATTDAEAWTTLSASGDSKDGLDASVRLDTVDPFGVGVPSAVTNGRVLMAWRTTPRAFLNGIDHG